MLGPRRDAGAADASVRIRARDAFFAIPGLCQEAGDFAVPLRALRLERRGLMLLAVGRIGRAHGVRGEVSVDVRTDDPSTRFVPGASLLTENTGSLTVETVRAHAGRLLVRFTGIEDRTAAETLRGALLLVDSAEIQPSEDPEEFHDHELIGLAAVTADGTPLGEIVDVEHHGQDLLVLRRPGGEDALVPFVTAIVPTVDVSAGRVVLDPPPGLLE